MNSPRDGATKSHIIKDCPRCGGYHSGSLECPYLESDPGGMIAAHQRDTRKLIPVPKSERKQLRNQSR
jgi:hypothetical protein